MKPALLHGLSIFFLLATLLPASAADLREFEKKISKIETFTDEEIKSFVEETVTLGMEYYQRLQWSVRILEAVGNLQEQNLKELQPIFNVYQQRSQIAHSTLEAKDASQDQILWGDRVQRSLQSLSESAESLEERISAWGEQKISNYRDDRWMDWNEMFLPAILHLLGLPHAAQENVKTDWQKRAPWALKGESVSVSVAMKFVGEELASIEKFLELRKKIKIEGLTDETEVHVSAGIEKFLPQVQRAYTALTPTEYLTQGSDEKKEREDLEFDLLSSSSRKNFIKTLQHVQTLPQKFSEALHRSIQETSGKLKESAENYNNQLNELIQNNGILSLTPAQAQDLGENWREQISYLKDLLGLTENPHKDELSKEIESAKAATDRFRDNLDDHIGNPDSAWRQRQANQIDLAADHSLSVASTEIAQRELAASLLQSKSAFLKHLKAGRYHLAWQLLEIMSEALRLTRQIPEAHLHVDLKRVMDGASSSPQRLEVFISDHTVVVYTKLQEENEQRILKEINESITLIQNLGSVCPVEDQNFTSPVAAEIAHYELEQHLKELREGALLRRSTP